MNGKQYNNIIAKTLKINTKKDADNLEKVRKIFKNMGVAFPKGKCNNVLRTLETNDYMAWRKCDIKKAKEKANNGTATIAVAEDTVMIIPADDIELIDSNNSDMLLNITPDTPAYDVSNLMFFAYSNGGTNDDQGDQGGLTTQFVNPLITLDVGETSASPELTLNSINLQNSTWSSSNSSVATVNPFTGHVKAMAPGLATITLYVEDLNISFSYDVRVNTKLYLPSTRNCNWNQHCKRINDITGPSGCSFACALDMINILGYGFGDTPANVSELWICNVGMNWASLPNYGVSASIHYQPDNPIILNTLCELIKTNINNGNLVLILGSNPHFILAYGYINNANSYNDILVLDPYKYDEEKHCKDTTETGNYLSLYDALYGTHATMGSIVGYGIASRNEQ